MVTTAVSVPLYLEPMQVQPKRHLSPHSSSYVQMKEYVTPFNAVTIYERCRKFHSALRRCTVGVRKKRGLVASTSLPGNGCRVCMRAFVYSWT